MQGWLEREGDAISRLLLHRAEWASARAVGELRSAGLAVGESLANAAMVLWPANEEAKELYGDLVAIRKAEAHPYLSFPQALAAIDSEAVKARFTAEEVEEALAAETEAERLMYQGFYHLAVRMIDRAMTLLRRQLGADALQTLHARRLRAGILLLRGRYADALAEIDSVVKVSVANPALGPGTPIPSASRFLLAQALCDLGRAAEALPVIEQVVRGNGRQPGLRAGALPIPWRSASLLARALCNLGRAAEALPIIEQVVRGNGRPAQPKGRSTAIP